MINELKSELEKAREAAERRFQINCIFRGSPQLKPEKILIQSYNLNNITDIVEKHKITEEVFDKLKLFKVLYKDANDLDALEDYVEQTTIPSMPDKPMEKPILPIVGNRGGELEWSGNTAWINGQMQNWLRAMGIHNFPPNYDNKKGEWSWGTQRYLHDWKPRAESEYARRLTIYEQQMADRNSRIAQAKAMPFPSDSFDRLVSQFNSFVNEL